MNVCIITIVVMVIIIKYVLIKVTLSCQRHCRGTANNQSIHKLIMEGRDGENQ